VRRMTANVEIRSGSDGDLDALVAVLGQRCYFTDHLARRQDDRGVLLVAWLDGRPVGDGFLSWEPADHPEIRRHLPGVPELSHLEVVGPLWGQGIGTALIRAAEATARQFGHDRLILAVGVDNPNARRLYERLGVCRLGSRDHRGDLGGARSARLADHPLRDLPRARQAPLTGTLSWSSCWRCSWP
jgi:GNAT superfamily N-acetyltransferase